jgi:hypothetical protein
MKRSTDPGDYEEAVAVEQPTRAALGSLHATGRRNTVPLERSQPVLPLHSANRGSLQLQQPQYTLPVANSTQPKFALFKVKQQLNINKHFLHCFDRALQGFE